MESVQAASRKKRRKENHATAGMGGWIGQACKADKQKDPFVFISVTFGCLAITLLHSKQRALPAEGKAKIKKRLWRQKQVSVFTDTVDSREWRQGSCGKGKDLKKNDGEKKSWRRKKGLKDHIGDAFILSWGSALKGWKERCKSWLWPRVLQARD